MTEPKRLRACGLAFALVAPLALAACSSGGSGGLLTGAVSNPFSSQKSDFEMTFLSASNTWDMNKDGTVTCDEWRQYATRAFQEGDANRDGALTLDEWSTVARNDALFVSANHDYYDANNDGKVTLEEMTGKQNAAFKMLDKNNDCQIAHDEKVNVYSVAKPKEKEQNQQMPGQGQGMGR